MSTAHHSGAGVVLLYYASDDHDDGLSQPAKHAKG